jgi:hypothetical protein
MNSYEQFLPPVSTEARQRIQAGVLEIEALWHTYPHAGEDAILIAKRYLGLAYDVLAREILSETDGTDELLENTLPKLSYDIVAENGWVRWITPNLTPTAVCTEHLFVDSVPPGSLEWAKANLLAGRIAWWRARVIRGDVSRHKTAGELMDEFRARKFPNLSHAALADEMNLEPSRYFKIKAGKRVSADAYIIVSDFTGIPVHDLKPRA